jgi:hypothetical protein
MASGTSTALSNVSAVVNMEAMNGVWFQSSDFPCDDDWLIWTTLPKFNKPSGLSHVPNVNHSHG